MGMINQVDCSPDTPVIDAAAERMALKEMEHEEFIDTNEMSGFQRGYSRGFLEGAEFMRSFYRHREMRDHLARIERERKTRENEKKQPAESKEDDRRIRPHNYSHDVAVMTPVTGNETAASQKKIDELIQEAYDYT